MTADEKMNSSGRRPINLPPWLVVLGALILYTVTLQHWVTLSSLPLMSKVTGWDWHPRPLEWRQTPVAPLFLILTSPIRILPASWQPVLLNLFSAICASLTLGLLAATIRLMPHDRTREQRQREGGEFALLSVPAAFLPPLFAVLMMGLQLNFWRHAISCSGDMFDLLLFAIPIYCLLKYRISQSDTWLMISALAYGIGMTNNWAMIGYFPIFLIALVWIKGVSFFNLGFLARMVGCGFLGLLLYLIVPAIASLSADRANFFSVLHMELGAQRYGLFRLVPSWMKDLALITLLPLTFAGIKWPSFEGDISSAGSGMTKLMFRVLHIVFLLLALVMFFDLRYSPSLRLDDAPIPFLTYYYMAALCIGYFSGYVLLVWGKTGQSWEQQTLVPRIISIALIAGLCLLAIGAPIVRFVKSLPHINAARSSVAYEYSKEMIRDLPAKPVIILSDDPNRQYMFQATYLRKGAVNNNIMIDTGSLPYREYMIYLLDRYPALQKILPAAAQFPHVMNSETVIKVLATLNHTYPIYYIQPSFGYYFEAFYLKPHGLVYEMALFTNDAIVIPPLSAQEIADNRNIWAGLEKSELPRLPALSKLDPNVSSISDNYSVSLDFWGVELQKAGYLPEANAAFAQSVLIHPQNFIAKINREYNTQLQKGNHHPINIEDLIYKAVNLYGGLVPILKFNGPPDEPGINAEIGQYMAVSHDFRQAAILLQRRLQLLPDDPFAELSLAKTFVDWGVPDRAFAMISKLRANRTARPWDVTRVEALAYLGKKDFTMAEQLLTQAYKEAPTDDDHVKTLTEFYRVTGEDALRQSNQAARQAQLATLHTNAPLAQKNKALQAQFMAEAGLRLTNALIYIERDIKVLTDASHNSSNPYGVPEMLLKKAEVQVMLRDFKSAIATLSKVIEQEPKNSSALLNRAVAETQVDDFAAAQEDYKTLRRLEPKQTFVVDYGLADISNRQKRPDDEMRYLKRYLKTAPDDTLEYQQVKRRLSQLQNH
jgi:tetratricopeptide (TPR) repeat protein